MTRPAVLTTILALLVSGCAAWSTPAPSNQPFFAIPPTESRTFQALIKKQDGLAAKCSETNACDHVYFTRALLGLYESREVAQKYFGKVLAVAPKSHLATTSKEWIQLLQQGAAPGPKSWPQIVLTAPALAKTNTVMAQTLDRLVRDLLGREVVIQQLRSTKEGDTQTVETLQRELADRDHRIESLLSRREPGRTVSEPAAVQSLQRQLVERDKKIEELSTQLEALKRIDQEMREKVRPFRPPATIAPMPAPDTP